MATAALVALAIIPAGLYIAAQNESRRKRRKWQRMGPLPVGAANTLPSVPPPSPSDPEGPLKGYLRAYLVDIIPAEEVSLGIGMGFAKLGVRVYDPFLVFQLGRAKQTYQISEKTPGRFDTALETTIPFPNQTFTFPLGLTHPSTLRVFLYGRKHRGKKREERLMAIGGVSMQDLARAQGGVLVHVPLITRKSVKAGYLRVWLKFDPKLPSPYLASPEEAEMDPASVLRTNRSMSGRPPIVVFSAGSEATIAVLEEEPVKERRHEPPLGLAGSSLS